MRSDQEARSRQPETANHCTTGPASAGLGVPRGRRGPLAILRYQGSLTRRRPADRRAEPVFRTLHLKQGRGPATWPGPPHPPCPSQLIQKPRLHFHLFQDVECRCWRKIRIRLFKGREKGVAILILLQICFCLPICAKTVYLHSQRSGHFCLQSIRLRTDFNNKLLLNTHLPKNNFMFQEHVDASPIVAGTVVDLILFQPKAASQSRLIINPFSYR